jgi:hypothetical protein
MRRGLTSFPRQGGGAVYDGRKGDGEVEERPRGGRPARVQPEQGESEHERRARRETCTTYRPHFPCETGRPGLRDLYLKK